VCRHAIPLPPDGLAVEDDLADSVPRGAPRLARFAASAKIFLKSDGTALASGDMLVQPDLARSLTAIARAGPRAFYEGEIAQKLVAAVRDAGGILSLDDLRGYRAVERV